MLKLHLVMGLILLLLGQFLTFYHLEPFSTYLAFILSWFGYILIIDAWVYYRTQKSRFVSDPQTFGWMFVISAAIWWFYELLNIYVNNWYYVGVGRPEWILYTLSFSTVLPAVIVTSDLLLSFNIFSSWNKRLKLTYGILSGIILLGIIALVLPFIFPDQTFPLVWISLFLLLDPINYLTKSPSLLNQLSRGKYSLLLSLMLGTLVCGWLWELWNFWAPVKWYYTIPYLDFIKIFEMPLLGYLGYIPFGLSLYALYWFIKSLSKQNPLS
ncbi:MAG TPA: hypothetical protein VJC39_02600 [Candidatus Nanoarchaeia archaeon]|nr:hypothetical protein [Candidatus Nanoarchaeia archaeon]